MKFSLIRYSAIFFVALITTLHTTAMTKRSASADEITINAESTIDEIREELKTMRVYVLEFSMQDSVFPTFDKIDHPEGCTGDGITNNEYVLGKLQVFFQGEELYDSGEYVKKESGVKVKVRGNTSSYNDRIKRKSYKVKLEKKEDLLFRGDKNFKDKEWVLLGHASDYIHYVPGFELGRILGLGWEPELIHVAVIMNNSYMGSYYLAEPVKSSNSRVDIDESGYIVENDAYWWKPDETYFKSNHQLMAAGWTFKEPDTDDFDEMSVENIKWVINTVEQKLFAEEPLDELIDFKTFAAWLLAHDIMNTQDPLGSNVFVTKYDFNHLQPFASKLEMGPVWDIDDTFRTKNEEFSLIHRFKEFWYWKIWDIPGFRTEYESLWLQVRDELKEKAMGKLKTYLEENPDIYKLRLLDVVRGLKLSEPEDPALRYEELDEWFDYRISALNKLILNESGIEEIDNSKNNENEVGQESGGQKNYSVSGLAVGENTKGLTISVDAKGRPSKLIR